MVAKGPAGVRAAVTGAGPSVFRLADAESALGGNFSADAVGNVQVSADGLNSDLHASGEYRAPLVSVMLKRARAAAAASQWDDEWKGDRKAAVEGKGG